MHAHTHRYIALDHEMEDISRIWRSAKDQLATHQVEMKKQQERRAHFDKIKPDGVSFKIKHQPMTTTKVDCLSVCLSVYLFVCPKLSLSVTRQKNHRQNHQTRDKTKPGMTLLLYLHCVCSSFHPSITFLLSYHRSADSTNHKQLGADSYPLSSSHTDKSSSGCSATSGASNFVPPELADRSFKSKQAAEWSKLLFKCIKPVGEPEFRLNGDIATHTITLHLEMTELDLSGAQASCTREDLKRYRKLGLTLEEIVEVAMKLNALKGLGVNLKIEGTV